MLRSAHKLIFVALFAVIALSTPAQEPSKNERGGFTDRFLDNLTGEWNVKRSIRGQTIENKATAKWVLNHSFLLIEMSDAKEPHEYAAHVYIGYDGGKKSYVVHWIDVFGGAFSETLGYGKREDSKIEFLFEYPDGPFRNTFTWDEKQRSWSFLMQNGDKNGNWTLFAEDRLTKRK